jgi:hypothetical protein
MGTEQTADFEAMMTALNRPEQFILAVVEVNGESMTPKRVRRPFSTEPDLA